MSIYKEELLEHYKDPQNFGELSDADVVTDEHNPLCGDQQQWFLQLTTDNEQQTTIKNVRFTGDGCAISMASASMLSEVLKGKSVDDILKMGEDDMKKIVGIDVAPARIKCLMLGLHSVQKGLKNIYE